MPSTRLQQVILASALLTFAVLGTACESAREMLANAPKPTAEIIGVAFKDIDLSGLTLAFDVEVSNPYSVALPVAAMDLALASRGSQFLKADSPDQGTISANGKRTFPLIAKVSFAGLLSVLQSVRPGAVVPYTADAGISVDAPAVGRLRLPVHHDGELPVPTAPDVHVQSIKWNNLSMQQASATVSLDVGNLNQFPIDLTKLSYDLNLGSAKVASSSLQRAVSFAAAGHQTLDIPISFKPLDFGVALFSALTGSSTKYSLAGSLEGKTQFGNLSLPFTRSGDASLVK